MESPWSRPLTGVHSAWDQTPPETGWDIAADPQAHQQRLRLGRMSVVWVSCGEVSVGGVGGVGGVAGVGCCCFYCIFS